MVEELMDEYYNNNARYVTQKEAATNLVSAVILQGVLDYRKELLLCVKKDLNGNYILKKDSACLDLERFFEDMGFHLYKKLPDGILKFHEQAMEIPDDVFENKDKANFFCPICGGEVVGSTRKQRVMIAPATLRHATLKVATCTGCGFKDIMSPDINAFIKSELAKLKAEEEPVCCQA